MTFPPIDPKSADRFALLRKPDGVYLVDGRLVPVRDDGAVGFDYGEPVVAIHDAEHGGVGVCGAVLGAHVEQVVRGGSFLGG